MAEQPYGDGPSGELERGPATPRWVRISGLVGLVLVLLVLALHLTGHSPSGH